MLAKTSNKVVLMLLKLYEHAVVLVGYHLHLYLHLHLYYNSELLNI